MVAALVTLIGAAFYAYALGADAKRQWETLNARVDFFPDARVRGEHGKLGFVFSLVTGLLGNQPAQLT